MRVVAVNVVVEHVLNRAPDERAHRNKPAVNPMHDCLQTLALPRVLALEQIKQPQHEPLINHLARKLGIQLACGYKPPEDFIHKRNVRPVGLHERLSVLRVVQILFVAFANRERAEQIRGDHGAQRGVYSGIRKQVATSVRTHVLHDFHERFSLPLLLRRVDARAREIVLCLAHFHLANQQRNSVIVIYRPNFRQRRDPTRLSS
mmetsp:Transcript_1275/g.2591  ORF Transcript_1275/g.2591 Transcript_1275/m.2591 type:complete len:204 (-) Transcript_1275:295-906(-)